MGRRYTTPELELISLDSTDVICESINGDENNEPYVLERIGINSGSGDYQTLVD